MEAGQRSFKISGPYLIRFRSEGVFKDLEEKDESVNKVSECIMKVFIEQPGYTVSVKKKRAIYHGVTRKS